MTAKPTKRLAEVGFDPETEELVQYPHEPFARIQPKAPSEFPPGVDMCRDCGGAHEIGSCPDTRRKYVDGCSSCELIRFRDGFGPWHDASDDCESGKRSHCSCDPCF